MKKGFLIYDKEGSKRNAWFIDRLIDLFSKKGVKLEYAAAEEFSSLDLKGLDFALVRSVAPEINGELEKKGVRVFNNYATSSIANDKWKTYLFCKELGIPVMETRYCEDKTTVDYPCVVKSCAGHGGSEVFWANDEDDYRKVASSLSAKGRKYVIQRPCSDLGIDERLYVLGGKVIAAVKRYNPSDFKSNYSLGGKVEECFPTSTQIEIAETVTKKLGSDYVGVDFILNDGHWVLNEIEDAVGARTLYALGLIDPASAFCDYVVERINRV